MRIRPLLLMSLVCSAFTSTAAAEDKPRASVPMELAVAMGTTAVISPAVYTGARFVGTSSPSLLTSAFPALLMIAALPPAIAAGMLSYERNREGARTGFVVPYLYGLGAQALVIAGAFLAQTWVAEPKDLMLLSAATGIVTGGAATLGAEIHFR